MRKTMVMKKAKETPGTVLYETESDGRRVTFYVPKTWLGAARPESIQLTIEAPAKETTLAAA